MSLPTEGQRQRAMEIVIDLFDPQDVSENASPGDYAEVRSYMKRRTTLLTRITAALAESATAAAQAQREAREAAHQWRERVQAADDALRLTLERQLNTCRKALETYGVHHDRCIRAQYREGRPTPTGGYECLYGYRNEKWYQAKPVDETPDCECGFAEALKAAEGTP